MGSLGRTSFWCKCFNFYDNPEQMNMNLLRLLKLSILKMWPPDQQRQQHGERVDVLVAQPFPDLLN